MVPPNPGDSEGVPSNIARVTDAPHPPECPRCGPNGRVEIEHVLGHDIDEHGQQTPTSVPVWMCQVCRVIVWKIRP